MAMKTVPAPNSESAATIDQERAHITFETAPAVLKRRALARGAARFQELLRELAEMSNSSVAAMWDAEGEDAGIDPRDYRAMVELLRANLDEHANHADPTHREGFMRAMVDYLVSQLDGDNDALRNSADPLRTTAAAFAAPAASA